MREKQPCVYIVASKRMGTIYTGVTSDVEQRVRQHRFGLYPGFTQKYDVHLLVHVECFATMTDAIEREKRIKNRSRAWEIRLIEATNPEWVDLYDLPAA